MRDEIGHQTSLFTAVASENVIQKCETPVRQHCPNGNDSYKCETEVNRMEGRWKIVCWSKLRSKAAADSIIQNTQVAVMFLLYGVLLCPIALPSFTRSHWPGLPRSPEQPMDWPDEAVVQNPDVDSRQNPHPINPFQRRRRTGSLDCHQVRNHVHGHVIQYIIPIAVSRNSVASRRPWSSPPADNLATVIARMTAASSPTTISCPDRTPEDDRRVMV